MILVVCRNVELMKKLEIANVVVDFLHIALPILLILFGITKFFKTFKSIDERIRKAGRIKAIRNIFLAVFIFYLPDITIYLNDLIFKDQESLVLCYLEASPENIKEVEKQIEQENYELLEATVLKVKETFDEEDYNKAFEIMGKISNSEKETTIKEDLESIKHYVDIKTEIKELEAKFNKAKYRKVYAEIEELDIEEYSKYLMDCLLELEAGTPLDIKSGLELKEYNDMAYYEIVPDSPTTKMPLIIYLPGEGGFTKENNAISYFEKGLYTKESFFYIAPNPKDSNKTWKDANVRKSLKNLIDKIVQDYEIDTKRIIITGYGIGGLGTWDMVSNYPNFFSAAVPISSGASIFNANSFKNTEVWALAGANEDEENALIMQELVDKIKASGGTAQLTKSKGKTYAKMSNAFANKEVIDWALSKKMKEKTS